MKATYDQIRYAFEKMNKEIRIVPKPKKYLKDEKRYRDQNP